MSWCHFLDRELHCRGPTNGYVIVFLFGKHFGNLLLFGYFVIFLVFRNGFERFTCGVIGFLLSFLMFTCVKHWSSRSTLKKKIKLFLYPISTLLGWFDMATMMTFKRLRSLTEDPSVVLTALSKSSRDLLQASGNPHYNTLYYIRNLKIKSNTPRNFIE